MIIQTDKFLIHLGKTYDWLIRSDLTSDDPSQLYIEYKVCKTWYFN